ncbi:hypothetical protein BCU84_19770 [Shewanella sp. 10N.286.51.B7]|uniref:hypothetical protein n=1 Tax=Shewanella sp. 10N.286.51.B7 TaxID=1880836 RepID=UPI000C822A6E|nr:hypothetical protein [Shewanella sp. 10N.286.51.B7]PMG72867.1 hypothetical protein BCU84_19770 [Shewanella sp. 10N.286.51.B7]
MSLSSRLLDSEWLKYAYETNWLERQLKPIRTNAERLYQQYYDDEKHCFNTDYEALYSEGNFAGSALILTRTWDEEEETRPIKVAIELDSPELVLEIMGLEGLTQCSEDNYLAIAAAHDLRDIFNLLLLHPDINVNDGYEPKMENREEYDFCINYNDFVYFSPRLWLIEDQYSFLYPYLDIFWNDPVTDHNGSPLIVHLYNKRDFDSMSRLASLKADINPDVYEEDIGLFDKALNEWRDSDPETQLGVKWFAQQTDYINQNGDDLDDLLSEHFEGKVPKSIGYLFPFCRIKELENELSELQEVTENLTYEFESVDKLINELAPNHDRWRYREQSTGTSIINDLLRLKIVKLEDGVIDIQFSITDMGIEFGVLYERQAFLSRILVPKVVLDKVLSLDLGLLHHMTVFQRQGTLLGCSTHLYLVLNIIAEDQGLPLFRSIKGHRVAHIERQNIISNILAGGVNDTDNFFEHLNFELNEYKNLKSFLGDLEVLNSLSTSDDSKALAEYRRDGNDPELTIELADRGQSRAIQVHCNIDGEKATFSHAIEEGVPIEDWADILFKKPISIACKQCKAIGYRHSFVNEEECMECINP